MTLGVCAPSPATGMKVVFLGGGSSIHTIRWINALSGAGARVVLVTQHEPEEPVSEAVKLRLLPFSGNIGYFLNARALKRVLAEEKPDLVNAHYASGYGTTARLAGFTPTLLSVWGSDVYDFPRKSALHRWWLRGNLMAATHVASTSRAMAEETRRVAPALGEIAITPFGVETDRFLSRSERSAAPDAPIVIGTVKTLKPLYGIDVLVESFARLAHRLQREAPQVAGRLKLRIVGDGPQRDELVRRAGELGIGGVTEFIPRVPHAAVPAALQALDVYVALSRQESFGVAIIEAGACGVPVVVSDAGGLPEVVADGETGIVVPRENPQAAAEALRTLVLDADLRQRMGEAARRRVVSLYEWQRNVQQMIDLYARVIAGSKGTRSQ
ncbi:glycosyltransferase [Hyphomicrobium sp.]|uniref:glycosyltransferase n=1 Tax=Hyphomicrobium sp. TaxID=82 RepID=UPI002FE33C04